MCAGYILILVGSSKEKKISFQKYEQKIAGTDLSFEMVPITSENTPGEDYWMASCEITWDLYLPFQLQENADAEGVTGPTPPYVPMDFGMGVHGYPAISMTQYAAKQYCRWLSQKTNTFYRLPTESEWEYACLAESQHDWYFGNSPELLQENGWFAENSKDQYHRPKKFPPNKFGLFDMHGNVAEWVHSKQSNQEWGRVVKGGSWADEATETRATARKLSRPSWKMEDPQIPKSIWYLTNAQSVGFRVVRPRIPPPEEEWNLWWSTGVESIRTIK